MSGLIMLPTLPALLTRCCPLGCHDVRKLQWCSVVDTSTARPVQVHGQTVMRYAMGTTRHLMYVLLVPYVSNET